MKTNHVRLVVLALFAAGAVIANADDDVITRSFLVKPGGKLTLDVDRGSVHITTSDSDKVDVKITRELNGGSTAEAKKVCDQHKSELISKDNEVKIEAEKPKMNFSFNNPFSQLRVNYAIAIAIYSPRRSKGTCRCCDLLQISQAVSS